MAACQLTWSEERGGVVPLHVCMRDVAFACEPRSRVKVTGHVSISGTTRDEFRGQQRGGI